MSGTAIHRFLTDKGWSEWFDLASALAPPIAPGLVNHFDGLPILKQETKPSKRSDLGYATSTAAASAVPFVDQSENMSETTAETAASVEEMIKEQMLAAIGISLNCEEPDVLAANAFKETARQFELSLENARVRALRAAEERASEKAYEGNSDYGQF